MALNRSELVAAVAEKSGNSQAAVNGVLDAVFEVFSEEVSNGSKVSVPGWLSVERTERAARTGRNPRPVRASRSRPDTPSSSPWLQAEGCRLRQVIRPSVPLSRAEEGAEEPVT